MSLKVPWVIYPPRQQQCLTHDNLCAAALTRPPIRGRGNQLQGPRQFVGIRLDDESGDGVVAGCLVAVSTEPLSVR